MYISFSQFLLIRIFHTQKRVSFSYLQNSMILSQHIRMSRINRIQAAVYGHAIVLI
jgi:hypothetical protein